MGNWDFGKFSLKMGYGYPVLLKPPGFSSLLSQRRMMTSSNGNIFRVTGPLCGEFTGHRRIPSQRPVTRIFDVFFHLPLNKWLSKHPRRRWFQTQSGSIWRHCNVMVDNLPVHYNDVIMSTIAYQITSLTIVYLTVYSGADQRTNKAPRHWRVGNSPRTGEFPTQRASNEENVSIWWRHHALWLHKRMLTVFGSQC